jgi:hypothetical protein
MTANPTMTDRSTAGNPRRDTWTIKRLDWSKVYPFDSSGRMVAGLPDPWIVEEIEIPLPEPALDMGLGKIVRHEIHWDKALMAIRIPTRLGGFKDIDVRKFRNKEAVESSRQEVLIPDGMTEEAAHFAYEDALDDAFYDVWNQDREDVLGGLKIVEQLEWPQWIQTTGIQQLLESSRFDQFQQPPELKVVFELAGKPICTPGNISALTAAAKTGKSALIGGFLAASMVNNGAEGCDTLGVVGMNLDCKAVIHMDTEQSEYDHWTQVDRARRRAGLKMVPDWLMSYCLTGCGPSQLRQALSAAIEEGNKAHGGIFAIIVDGVADLACDVNDAEECNELVTWIHGIAIANECPIVCAIHFNPGSEKVRGHLGSQIERKAETNLILSKEDEVITVWSSKQRRAPILKGEGPSFKWSDEAKMHTSCEVGTSAKTAEKVEELRSQRNDVFGENSTMRNLDMFKTFMEMYKKSESSANRWIKNLKRHCLIEPSIGSYWIKKG